MGTSKLIMGLVLAGALLFGAQSSADTLAFEDSNDSDYPLDVESYSHGHIREAAEECLRGCPARLITHSFTAFEPWANEIITGGRSGTNVIFSFDTLPRRHVYNRSVVLGTNPDGSLYARMVRLASGRQETVGYVRVWRPDERSVTIAFPKRQLMKEGSKYRWDLSIYYQEEDAAVCDGCGDSVESVVHRL